MSTKREVTPARVAFLQFASHELGVYSVPDYPPAQWALKHAYTVPHESSLSQYVITEAGRRWLADVVAAQEKDKSN